MPRPIPFLVLILSLTLTGFEASAATASTVETDESLKDSWLSPNTVRPITLRGEGQLDLQFSHAAFSGQAMHLGRFTAIGDFNLTQTQIRGEMTFHNGITLPVALTFFGQPDFRGETPGMLSFGPGDGRWTNGFASGTLTIADDRSFTFTFDGILREDEPPPPPCFIHPCLDSL